MIKKILQKDDPVLHKVCHPVTNFDQKLAILLDDMTATLKDAQGLGLAAPQIGILRRVCIVLNDQEEYLELLVRGADGDEAIFEVEKDDDEDEEPAEETEASPEEVLQYAWETVCYVIWGKASAKGGQKVVETAPEELRELYRQFFIPITENLEEKGGLL